MGDEIRKYLFDISESINSIHDYLGKNRDFNAYLNNKVLRRAVEREFEIIGEAINNIIRIDKNIEIENARRIVDFRNRIIHGYDSVDNVIVWGIISRDLPELKTEVDKLLKE